MDGNGLVANGSSIAATVGTALSASNVNQSGLAYTNGRLGQGRTCTSSSCADNPSWQGPDGTSGTYFSELENASAGATLPTPANLQFGYVAPALAVSSTNAYMQYRIIM